MEMTKSVKGIWVSQDGFIHDVLGNVVKFVTGGSFAHNAIGIYLPEYNDEVIIEAIAPRVTVQDKNKYADEFDIYIREIPFSEENFIKAQEYARKLINESKPKYGLFSDCVAGLFAHKLSKESANWWAEKFGGNTMDCSEVFAEFVRIQYPEYLSEYEAGAITPEMNLWAWTELESKLKAE